VPANRHRSKHFDIYDIAYNNRERIDTLLRNNFDTFKCSYIYFQLNLPRMSLEVFIILPNTLNDFLKLNNTIIITNNNKQHQTSTLLTIKMHIQ
jgi:hypothetical protein